MADPEESTETKARFLTALARKGETIEELAGFAGELRNRCVELPLSPETRARGIIDVCGTGGDRLGTFNISTTIAFIVAASGVAVAKHGNRAITSQAGSADTLEALGVPTTHPPKEAARALAERQFTFLFAPQYHPAFKHIMPARKQCAERGQRTLFNFLGPLLNPARPDFQLIGVPAPALCQPMAHVLRFLGVRRGMVVSGRVEDGFLDELSTLGDNTIVEFSESHQVRAMPLDLASLPIRSASLKDLAGGDRQANALTLQRLLLGEDRGAKRDAVLLNAGAALYLAGKASSVAEGWSLAADLIDSGQAWAKLEQVRNPVF